MNWKRNRTDPTTAMKNDQSHSKRFRTVANALIALMILFFGMIPVEESHARAAETGRIVSGSEIDYPPFCIVDSNGRAGGFSVELMQAALSAMGREVTFRTGPWTDVRGWLEKGEIQALPLVGRTPERETIFDFTFPYMSLYGAIVVRSDTTDIQDLNDLKGRTVAVMTGDNADEFLRREERGIRIHNTTTFDEALRELSDGRHDAVVAQRLVALRLIRETGLKNLRVVNRPIDGFRQDFCFAVREGDRDTLALLNEGLALVMADGTYRHLHAKWFAALELPSNRRIVVGGDHNYPPYDYLDENGKPAGYNVELTRAISRVMDLDIEIRLGSWSNIVEDLERGEIDVVQGMFYSPDRDLKFDFTMPHASNQYVGVVRRNSGPPPATREELTGRRIAVQKGDVVLDFLAQDGIDSQVVVADSQEDVLQMVNAGQADCALVVRIVALNLIERRGWSNLQPGAQPLYSMEYCYAVQNGHKALLTTFSEGLNILEKSGEYRRIHEKWLGVHKADSLHLTTILRYVALVAGPLVLALLGFLLWSWTLRRQVALRTGQLARSKERIEHLNQVLRAIRDVNQLIVHERDPDRLIREACRLMVEHRGYRSALIVLTDNRNQPASWAMAGHAADATELTEIFQGGGLLPCFEHLRQKDGVLLVHDRQTICAGCPIAADCANSQSICSPLIHETKGFGYLAAAAENYLVLDAEDQSLFGEMAGDLAYALHFLQIETQRRVGEKDLRESESRFRMLAELAPVGIVISDEQERVIYVSPKFVDLFGYTATDMPSVGEWWQLAYPDETFRNRVRQEWESALVEVRRTHSEIKPMEYPVTCKDGSVRQIEFRLASTNHLNFIVFTDVTERRHSENEREKLQAQLLQSQKMEAVGRLAGGVAHDFNNMLNVIMGYTEWSLTQLKPDDAIHHNLQEVLSAARRSADITRQLLAFARKQTVAPRVLDLNETVEGMLKMLRRLIGEDIDLYWKPGSGLGAVKMDPSQIDQILANLCVNARDAISGVGRLTIETANVRFDPAYCADHSGFVPGEYVMLAVSDNGCGMDKETLKNLFEPFFTTKDVGQGTGLGLATVYGIVRQNEGFINVYSEPDQGSTFRIYLPRHTEKGDQRQNAPDEKTPSGHGETILLVEDEASVLKLARIILEGLGYTVLTAATPGEAERLAEAHAGRIDLLITDVIMPAMNGRDLSGRLHARYPEIKTLFMSGYTANVIAHHGVLDDGVHFMQKPFSRSELAAKVRESLEG
ncbi:MAG: transporter substrate-binding domain-containing protein [Desulfatirhabdiaceae bacterium]